MPGMTNEDLIQIARSCGGPFPRANITAEFIVSDNRSCLWRMKKDGIHYMIPEFYMDAPLFVLKDIIKGMVQIACYSSFAVLSDETKNWIAQAKGVA